MLFPQPPAPPSQAYYPLWMGIAIALGYLKTALTLIKENL